MTSVARTTFRGGGTRSPGITKNKARTPCRLCRFDLEQAALDEPVAELAEVGLDLHNRPVVLMGDVRGGLADAPELFEDSQHAPAGRVESVVEASLQIQDDGLFDEGPVDNTLRDRHAGLKQAIEPRCVVCDRQALLLVSSNSMWVASSIDALSGKTGETAPYLRRWKRGLRHPLVRYGRCDSAALVRP